MKYLINIIFFILAFVHLTSAQDSEDPIALFGTHTYGEVRLIWSVSDPAMWKWGTEVGYTVTRYTMEDNGQELFDADYQNSKYVLTEGLKPASEAEYNAASATNPMVSSAKELIYDTAAMSHVIDPADLSLATVLQAKEKKDMQFTFSQMIGSMDYEIAKLNGMAIADDTAEPNMRYVYKITFSQPYGVSILDQNDFETGWGNWIDGGTHSLRFRRASFAQSGLFSILIRNGTPSSNASIQLSVVDFSSVKLEFGAYVYHNELGDAMEIQSSPDGVNYTTVKRYEAHIDYNNFQSFTDEIVIDAPGDVLFLKYEMKGNHNNDIICLDDIKVRGIPSQDIKTNAFINTEASLALDPLVITEAMPGDKIVDLKWSTEEHGGIYTYYDIERADVSETPLQWQKVNDLPFIFFRDERLPELPYVIYSDSLPNNETTFAYRVCGKSPYGVLSPPSDTIHAKGVPSKMDLTLQIDSFQYISGADDLIVRWESLEPNQESAMTGYNILRSAAYTGPFTKLNENLLDATTYAYNDNNPLLSNYYMLEGVDENGHTYGSLIEFYQLPDSTAPADPVITDLRFISEDRVYVEWDHVDDADLNGYRLCVSNSKQGTFIQNHAQPLTTNSYTFTVTKETEIDSLYVCVSSEDYRQNISKGSESVGISRPDLFGPSDPVISSLASTPNGVHLNWQWSSSEDIVEHKLQRRAMSGPSWVDVVAIDIEDMDEYPTDGTAPSYIDSSYVEVQDFQYRLLAYDDNDNSASSKLFSTRPYTAQVGGGTVSSVNLTENSTATLTPPEVQKVLFDLQQAGVTTKQRSQTSEIHSLTLDWSYPLDGNVKEFQIYRAMSGGTMQLYKTVNLAKAMGHNITDAVDVSAPVGNSTFSFTDDNLTPNRRYTYQVKTVHKDGSVSERSEKVSKLIQ